MSETNQVVETKTMKTPKKASAAAKPKKPVEHPKYSEMVSQAVSSLKERGGSSRQAILKYIVKNFKVGNDEKVVNTHLKTALKSSVVNGSLKQSKGTGASGSFKIGEVKKVVKKPKKVTKPKAAVTKPKAKKVTKAKKESVSTKKAAAKPKKAAAAAKPKKAAAAKPKKAAAATPKKQIKPKKAAATPKKAKTPTKPKKAAAKPKKTTTKK